MNRIQNMALVALFSFLTFSVYAADDASEAADEKSNTIVLACESQFTMEAYPDDAERSSKIDACIEEGLKNDSSSDDKG